MFWVNGRKHGCWRALNQSSMTLVNGRTLVKHVARLRRQGHVVATQSIVCHHSVDPVTSQILPTYMNLISGATRLLCARHANLSCKHWPYPLNPCPSSNFSKDNWHLTLTPHKLSSFIICLFADVYDTCLLSTYSNDVETICQVI